MEPVVTSGSVPRFWRGQPQVSLRGAWSVATGDLRPLTTVRRFPKSSGVIWTLSTPHKPRISLTSERYVLVDFTTSELCVSTQGTCPAMCGVARCLLFSKRFLLTVRRR